MTDYVQDISVFIVSNFRLPVFEKEMRERAATAMQAMFKFGDTFAKTNGDQTYQTRLALGLARSMFTSTRFEMNYKFARDMYLRACYLLEKLLEHQGRPWSEFKLPLRALIHPLNHRLCR